MSHAPKYDACAFSGDIPAMTRTSALKETGPDRLSRSRGVGQKAKLVVGEVRRCDSEHRRNVLPILLLVMVAVGHTLYWRFVFSLTCRMFSVLKP